LQLVVLADISNLTLSISQWMLANGTIIQASNTSTYYTNQTLGPSTCLLLAADTNATTIIQESTATGLLRSTIHHYRHTGVPTNYTVSYADSNGNFTFVTTFAFNSSTSQGNMSIGANNFDPLVCAVCDVMYPTLTQWAYVAALPSAVANPAVTVFATAQRPSSVFTLLQQNVTVTRVWIAPTINLTLSQASYVQGTTGTATLSLVGLTASGNSDDTFFLNNGERDM
jgi:hypothetical protein